MEITRCRVSHGGAQTGLLVLVALLLIASTNLITYALVRQSSIQGATPPPPTASADEPLGKFAIVNAHDHLYREQDLQKYLDAAAAEGVVKTLFVASSYFTFRGEGNSPAEGNEWSSEEILKVARKHPGKIIPFVTLHPDAPDPVKLLEGYVANGAQGVKLYTGHGNFHDRSLLAQEMLPVYAYCEKTGLPICWHVNLTRYGAEFTKVLLQFPKLKIILPHFGVAFYKPGGKEWKQLEQLMDLYPNLYVDCSFGTRDILVAGLERVSAQPQIFRAFYEKYQDRILWGTDMVVTGNKEKTTPWIRSILRACRDMHEKATYQFWMAASGCQYAARKDNPYGLLRGLDLPDEILKKLYETNIENFLSKTD